MPLRKFSKIIQSKGLAVHVPNDSHFSFGTSPYFAHQHGLALDIYQSLKLENYPALSPVSGTIIKIREMRAPKPRFKDGIDKEYLTIIESTNTRGEVFKILHVKTKLNVGNKVEVGDELGNTIKNGYFAPWSSPHLHLEIRRREDAVRASGGARFCLSLDENEIENKAIDSKLEREIQVRIEHVCSDFFLGSLKENSYHTLNPITGLKGKINGKACILDGGIPLYKKGMIIQPNLSEADVDEKIFLGKEEIGRLKGHYDNFGFYDFKHIRFSLNNEKLRGISLFLSMNKPYIKLIPETSFTKSIKLNEIHELKVSR